MNQEERRVFLIEALVAERDDGSSFAVPESAEEQRRLLRALMNVRPPAPVSEEVLRVQDAYLSQRREERGVVAFDEVTAECATKIPNVYLWQGDITTLAVDAIVNAANSQMLGCFVPGHHCIDNCIHTYAGMQLRLACAEIMREQGYEEPTGCAKITSAFNLPAMYVLHSVGPIVMQGDPTADNAQLLASCYTSCLDTALASELSSVAFCCISTGVFGYPARDAAQVAVDVVGEWLREHEAYGMNVVFDVFSDSDAQIYESLLR